VHAVVLAGVVGRHDVSVMEPRRGFDLAVETGDGVFASHRRGGEHLDGHNPLHATVLGLEHDPHAPRADAIQDDILAKRERGVLALVNDSSLIPRQLALPDERLGQRFSVSGLVGRQTLANRRDVRRRQQSGRSEILDILVERDGHAATPSSLP
jgi:hypothetical protein